ncbi:MAG TPA: glycosyltransferase family 4 protein [Verrucomicrobiae bacterium]|nr:glycosyltransferase family 4 protein [Verrucomicrobiae bacterium]
MKVLLAHPGTQYSFHLARQLERIGLLHEFWTGFALPEASLPTRVMKRLPKRTFGTELANRVLYGVPPKKLKTTPLLEWRALRKIRRGFSSQTVMHERNRSFQRQIPDSSIARADIIIGFDTSSWMLAERAAAHGKIFILDQSICHPLAQAGAQEEALRRFPAWCSTVEPRDPTVLACETKEYNAAARIVVASGYTRRTLAEHGVSESKICVNPYGVDLQRFAPAAQRTPSRRFRFVFVGSIGSRKGVPLLCEAWRALMPKAAELWLVGPVSPAVQSLIPPLPGLRILGKTKHDDLPSILRQCDVLVLPSYSEGFGLVLLEAMASGLPIIATTATAAPDIVAHGREGLILAPGDVEQLAACLRRCIEDPQEVSEMATRARARALSFSWDTYGERWAALLQGCAA